MSKMTVEEAVERREELLRFVSEVMLEGSDFMTLPGVDKPSLLQPGAEKLARFYGLRSESVLVDAVQDWTGKEHGEEPLFAYWYKCNLYDGDVLVASADGACSSWEPRYRYRKSERACTVCGATAIIKGRDEYGGGWVCWKQRGGCGAKFKDGDPSIESQPQGRVVNEDIFDQVNTILQMAQKRPFVSAVKRYVAASELFTMDMEDREEASSKTETKTPPSKVSDWPLPEQKLFLDDIKTFGKPEESVKLLEEWGPAAKFSELPWTGEQAKVAVNLTRYAFEQGMELGDVHKALEGTIGAWVLAGKELIAGKNAVDSYIKEYA